MQITDSESRPIAEEQFPRQLDIATVSVYGLAILSAGMFMFLPLVNLIHPSPWQRSFGFLHGAASMLTTIVVAYAGHLAFPLLRGSAKVLPAMRTLSFWSSIITFLGIASGNFAYMRYRADISYGGARAWLKENSPLTQYIFMEYHEFTVLFTLPLSVACTWALWNYGDAILERKNRPVLTAVCVGMMATMFFAMGGFVSGLAIAKVRAL
jgi:hypothetical protein